MDDHQDPRHWRDKAAEIRAKAEGMSSPELKERMLVIAMEYDKLAEFVHRQGNGGD